MANVSDETPISGEASPKKRSRKKIVLGIVAAIVVVAAIAVGYSFARGDLAPVDAAAKYDGFNYLMEDEVNDYIALYREQMEVADVSDEDWATFLAAYGMTPSALRYSTIEQLLTDKLVQKKADELGLQASEAEIDASLQTLRDTLGLGDDEILQQTLAAHGQTEEGLREVYRKAIVKRLVLSAEVETPVPTDDQVREFLKSFTQTLQSPVTKHSYCFRLSGRESDENREKSLLVQRLRDEFAAGDKSVEEFAQMVGSYSDDETLVESNGANGWDVDSSDYGSAYAEALDGMQEGDVSQVFVEDDGDTYAFIWVNDEYVFPTGDKAIDALDPADVPESLWSYLSDSAAYGLWEAAGQDYLDQLLVDAGVVYYPMPANVPYNVDMSLADVQLEEVTASDASASATAQDASNASAASLQG